MIFYLDLGLLNLTTHLMVVNENFCLHFTILFFLFIYLSASVCTSIFLSKYMSVCEAVSICLSVFLNVCLTVYYKSDCFSICQSVSLSVCLAVYLTICLYLFSTCRIITKVCQHGSNICHIVQNILILNKIFWIYCSSR